jgi:hypothetical protein
MMSPAAGYDAALSGRSPFMFKIEVENDKGIWSDVYGDDGKLLTFGEEGDARAALAQRFPVLVQMEKYAGGKRTRVIRILEDEDDWPKK